MITALFTATNMLQQTQTTRPVISEAPEPNETVPYVNN